MSQDFVGGAVLLPGAADAHEVIGRDPARFLELAVPDHQEVDARFDAGRNLGRIRRIAHGELLVRALERLEVGNGVVALRRRTAEIVESFHGSPFQKFSVVMASSQLSRHRNSIEEAKPGATEDPGFRCFVPGLAQGFAPFGRCC